MKTHPNYQQLKQLASAIQQETNNEKFVELVQNFITVFDDADFEAQNSTAPQSPAKKRPSTSPGSFQPS